MTFQPADGSALDDGADALGIDLRAERLLLSTHDVESLRRGVRRAIDRQLFSRGVVAGAAGALLFVAAAALAWGSVDAQAPAGPAASVVVAAAMPPPVFTDPGFQTPAPVCPPLGVVAPPAPPPVAAAPRRRAPPEDAGPLATAPDATARRQVGSRLQVWLAAYKDIETALADGRTDHAVAEARSLRQRYPDGALSVEAGLLELRALRRASRHDEANALEASRRDELRDGVRRDLPQDLRQESSASGTPTEESNSP